MKKLITNKVLMLVLIAFSTSCKKSEDSPTPSNVTSTKQYSYTLGVAKSDSTYINTNTYTNDLSYTLDIIDFASSDITISDITSITVYDKADFYATDTDVADKTIRLYGNYQTFQNNNQTIKARVVTGSTINEITINIKLLDDVVFEVTKHLINNFRANTAQITKGAMLWKLPLANDFNPTNKQSWGLSFPYYPNDYNSTTSVSIAGVTTQENGFITLQINKGKLQVCINDNNNTNINKYTITSFSNSSVYLKDNSNNIFSIDLY